MVCYVLLCSLIILFLRNLLKLTHDFTLKHTVHNLKKFFFKRFAASKKMPPYLSGGTDYLLTRAGPDDSSFELEVKFSVDSLNVHNFTCKSVIKFSLGILLSVRTLMHMFTYVWICRYVLLCVYKCKLLVNILFVEHI